MKRVLSVLSTILMLALLGACNTTPADPPIHSLALIAPTSVMDSIPQVGDFGGKQADRTFVGHVEGTPFMMGVVATSNEFAAFVSDGALIGEWMSGPVRFGAINFTSPRGTALLLKVGSSALTGMVKVQGKLASGMVNLLPAKAGRTGLFHTLKTVHGVVWEQGMVMGRDGIRLLSAPRSGQYKASESVMGSEVNEPEISGGGTGQIVVNDMYPPDAPKPGDYLDAGGLNKETACQYYGDLTQYLEAKIYAVMLELDGVMVVDMTKEDQENKELLDFLMDRLLNSMDQVDSNCFGITYN